MTHKNQTYHRTHTKALIFFLLTLLVVSVGCKKDKPIVPAPATAESLVGTTWKENTDEKVETQKFKITFLTDSTFDCSRFKDEDDELQSRTITYADGITRIDTLGLGKTRYIFNYKDGKGNIICKISNYHSNWVMLTQNPYTEGYRRRLDQFEGTIANFTISNNTLNLTYIDTSKVNIYIGLSPAPAPVTIVKQ